MIWNRICSLRYISNPLFLIRPTTENYKISHMREDFGLTKYPREKVLDPQNTQEKKPWTHEIPTRKNLGPTKYPRENIWDPRKTHEKKFGTHKIPTRKILGPTKARWHGATRPTIKANNDKYNFLIKRCPLKKRQKKIIILIMGNIEKY